MIENQIWWYPYFQTQKLVELMISNLDSLAIGTNKHKLKIRLFVPSVCMYSIYIIMYVYL